MPTKICTKCGVEKDVTEFYRNKNNKDGYHSRCKECDREHECNKHPEVKRYKNSKSDPNVRVCIMCGLEKPLSEFKSYKAGSRISYKKECNECLKKCITATKICSECNIEKPISDFGDYKSSRDGKTGRCKQCLTNWYSEYYNINRDKIIKNVREYELENKEKVGEKKKQYREENKECISEWFKGYSARNRKHLSDYSKQYREDNLEACKIINNRYNKSPKGKSSRSRVFHKRRIKNKELKNDLTLRQWNNILKMQNHSCPECGRKFQEDLKPVRDHIIPISSIWCIGLTYGNVQALCTTCNCKKHSKFNLGNAINNLLVIV